MLLTSGVAEEVALEYNVAPEDDVFLLGITIGGMKVPASLSSKVVIASVVHGPVHGVYRDILDFCAWRRAIFRSLASALAVETERLLVIDVLTDASSSSADGHVLHLSFV